MSSITLRAAYASVVEDDGHLFIGFAEGEDEDEPYVLIRQDTPGGAIWLEVEEEEFGALDAIDAVRWGPQAVTLTIAAEKRSKFSFATTLEITFAPGCEGLEEAKSALRDLFSVRFTE